MILKNKNYSGVLSTNIPFFGTLFSGCFTKGNA